MSEYQSYEFQALDRALTNDDQSYLRALSSRAEIGATNARFIYNYSDFRSNPIEVLERCFDMMLYVANFGVRQLAIRLPKNLVNPAIFTPYCDTECISTSTTKKSTILNIQISMEDYYQWIEEESWLPNLVGLREEVLQGDLRLLYLAWLQSGFDENADAELKNMIEPPIPANLKQLSPALESFVELFAVDRDLIAAAADASPTSQAIAEPIEDWIAALPELERNRYLGRVAKGESHVGAELVQHLRQLYGKPIASIGETSGRSLADLVAIAEEKQNQRASKEKQAAKQARRRQLDALALKVDIIWKEISRLIELKQSKPYDEAVSHLIDLRDLADYQGKRKTFDSRIQEMQQQYSNRPGLLSRLQKAGFSKR